MDVDEVIDALYAAHPSGFTAARTEAAARAKEEDGPEAARRIKAMRRPTLAAWASNLLVRSQPEEAEQFLQLAQALRSAHHALDGERLRALSHRQHVVIGALAREAGRLAAEAGSPISEPVVREVERILYAVLAGPEASAEWASGRLVRTPEPEPDFPAADPDAVRAAAGRGPDADAADAGGGADTGAGTAARTGAGTGTRVGAGGGAARDAVRDGRPEAARAAVEEAEREAAAREEELREADGARRRAVESAAAADAEAARLEREAERARDARDRAYTAVTGAEARHREAGRAAKEARDAATAAQDRLRAPGTPGRGDAGRRDAGQDDGGQDDAGRGDPR
ncbi:hypothetical protein [Streptomyces sp. NPDC057939]|uniref:hypothetical protein n=1 Tax=Streptomyces sp. NPDC057939 TaxID=3346284 RepID=UPI0036E48C0A